LQLPGTGAGEAGITLGTTPGTMTLGIVHTILGTALGHTTLRDLILYIRGHKRYTVTGIDIHKEAVLLTEAALHTRALTGQAALAAESIAAAHQAVTTRPAVTPHPAVHLPLFKLAKPDIVPLRQTVSQIVSTQVAVHTRVQQPIQVEVITLEAALTLVEADMVAEVVMAVEEATAVEVEPSVAEADIKPI